MATKFNNQIKTVLISDDVNQKAVDILSNNGLEVTKNTKLTVEELKEAVKTYDCLVVRSATKVTADILKSAAATRNLKLVARAGTGVDNIDVDAASELGVLVMNALGSNTISAVELTCAHLMSMARSLPRAHQSMKEGKWERSKFLGTELYGKTLALLGLGRIGREVASRMRAFGMHVIGYDPVMSVEQMAEFGVAGKSLDEIWPVADYISVHVPLLKETENLIGTEVIGKCKQGFRVVNCARGGIIDEEALLAALASGKCGGAGLDVWREEPTKNAELVAHPNVVCTPHLGASTSEAQHRVAVDIAEQISTFAKEGKLIGGVNADKIAKQQK